MTTTDHNPNSDAPSRDQLSRIETLPDGDALASELTPQERTGIFIKFGHWVNENWLHRGIALGVGASVVGGAITGVAAAEGAFNGPNRQTIPVKPISTPEATATANPETMTPAEITKSFEMPNGLSPEQKADWIAKNFTRWFNYGQTKAQLLSWANDGQGSDDGTFLHNAAAANSASIINGIFVADPSPALATEIGTLTAISGDTLNFWADTSTNHPYTRSITINLGTAKVDPQDPNTIDFTATEHTNEEDNRVSTSLHKPGAIIINGNVEDWQVTLQEDETTEKISALKTTNVNPQFYPQ